MSELYNYNRLINLTIKQYEQQSKDYGWQMTELEHHWIYSFNKRIKLNQAGVNALLTKVSNTKGYTLDRQYSDKDAKSFINESIGQGFSLTINSDEIGFSIDAEKKLNKNLEEILKELNTFINSNL